MGIGAPSLATLGDSPHWGMSPCPYSPMGVTCQLQDICNPAPATCPVGAP